ncbi:hypothetical protein HL657_06045 [Methanoculleus sp. YWC-01]|jgi:hypothetical protein|uniref:Uncharacterized protein n=1 Tax=Methanoculleus nereidis TaxID=2735141 RepID=A0ABU3Z1Q5_9EURY|nr:hypothetical protein [Methanoculleus sp. YWC-01]MCK9298546.1 hypothetical protein [Methanoculleus sp.]MDV4342739.1 hypothetical protein [Methanoculleus sp. YWC-01]PKL56705.1 MAG: hypothetical protein CVV35_03530 [Methanomicrobiales archaeon HGW-Methanomicrobiales-6]
MAPALLPVIAFFAVPRCRQLKGGYPDRPSASDDPVMILQLHDSIGQGETNRHQSMLEAVSHVPGCTGD